MNIKDSVCVLGGALTGVFLGFGISYKMLRDQSAHFKQLQDKSMEHQLKLEVKCVGLEQFQSEVYTTLQKIDRKTDEIEKVKENLKSVRKRTEANSKYLKENQDQNEEQKKIIEATQEKIFKRIEDNLVEYKTSLQPLEHQLKLLEEISVSLEQINCKVHTTSEKINIHTEENIKEKMKSNMSRTDDLQDLEEDTPTDNFQRDILILHADMDYTEAYNCKELLMKHMNINNLQVAVLAERIDPGKKILPELGSFLDTCRLIFIYQTKNLKLDTIAYYGGQMQLVRSLTDITKSERVIPLDVDGTESVFTNAIEHLKYIKDIHDSQFTNFQGKVKRLVDKWRKQATLYCPTCSQELKNNFYVK
ncbi:uncharacterized protein LOC143047706 isoform X2 [Mytilus galloprovincialis]|uniref:uncharacterized protein LOC143047706 isoform X2 n=1 Tax=Mytilus galloprovincialis TaxID=29158 RepID=UPI003F7B8A99